MSDFSVGRLVAEVYLNTMQFERGYTALSARMQSMTTTFERAAAGSASVDRGLMSMGESATKASAGLSREAAAQEKAAAAARVHADATVRVAAVMKENSSASTRAQQAALRQAAAQSRLNEVEASGTATTRSLASAQAALIGAQRSVAASSESLGARMSSAGGKISRAVTLPVLAAAALSVKSAMDFQQATNVYVTAAGESEKNLGVVRDGIKRIAVETGTGIKNLTDAEYLLEKAGLRGADGLKVLDAAAKGAREENANLADVVQGETSIMASYHLSANKAVQVMNALKTGAGQAKAPMEDYVKSLSTVIPVASAAGVSLEQVLGAYSTLTQHGTSTAEATQELAFTIRNLQAPNNVAVAAMNQLGISAVNVSSNLGKRGLTGTLEYIESKLPKSGLVYLSTMKQMEAGTKDLNAMQAKMPPQLAQLSKGFLDGSVTAKSYTADIKGMGASGYAQGLQFKSLADKVLGYNDSIKNGTPAQKTMAAELKAMYGGANGLNTVLQLGGQNLDGFKQRTDAVGKSLHDNATQVEGWASTSKLASVQADILKQRLHVMAIDAGTSLLPMFTKVVNKGDDLVKWIGNLSSTDKQILGWSLGFVAALGPVLSVGGKLATVGKGIGSFVGGTSSRLATFVGATESQAARVSTAMRGMTAALAGAGIGIALGTVTAKSGTTAKAIGALTSTAAGAAIGFGTGGPLGAAIGGTVGLVSNLATTFLTAGHDASSAGKLAKEGLDAQNEAAATLLGTLQQVGGAYSDQYKQQLVSQLDKKGVLGAAQKVGIDPQAVVRAAMGSQGDITKLVGALTGGVIPDKQAQRLLRDFIAISKGAAGAEASYERQQAALGHLQGAIRPTDQSLKGLRAEFANTGLAIKDVVSTQEDAAARTTASGRRVTAILRDHATAIGRDAAAQLAHGKSSDVVASSVERQVGALHDNLVALGFNEKQVTGLIATYTKLPRSVVTKLEKRGVVPADIQAILNKYGQIPANKNTNVHLNDAQARAEARALQAYINGMQATIHVATVTGSKMADPRLHATGTGSGVLPGGWAWVGEGGAGSRPELTHTTSRGTQVFSTPQSKAIANVHGWAVPGGYAGGTGSSIPQFGSPTAPGASGGAPGGVQTSMTGIGEITTSHVAGKKVWIYKGKRYASERAAMNAQDTDAKKLGGGIVDTATLPGVKGVADLIKGHTRDAAGAMRLLSKAVTDAFDLKGVQKKIADVKQQITDMTDYRTGVMSTLAGAADLMKAGSVADLESALAGGTATNTAYAGEVKSLQQRAHGNKALLGFISQLAEQGQTATLQTLAGSSNAQLTQITKDVGAYNSSLSLGGNAAVLAKYGTSITAQQAQEKTLVTSQKALVGRIDHLLTAISKLTGRPARIELDGKVVGRTIVEPEVIKVLDELGNHLQYGHASHR